MAALMEYMTKEILSNARDCAVANKKKTIAPRHIMIGIRKDEDVNTFLKHVTFPCAGVVPHIEEELLPPVQSKNARKRPADKYALHHHIFVFR